MKKKIQSKPFQTECIMRWKSKEPTVYLCIIFLLEVEIRSFAILHFQWDNSCPSPPFISGFYFGFFHICITDQKHFHLFIHVYRITLWINFQWMRATHIPIIANGIKISQKKAQRKMLWKHSHTNIDQYWRNR